MKKLMVGVLAGAMSLTALNAYAENIDALVQAAKKEGAVNSVGMPDDWANWKDTWAQITQKYGIAHQDTDMSSAQ